MIYSALRVKELVLLILLSMAVLGIDNNVIAKTIEGYARVLDYEDSTDNPRRCVQFSTDLASDQQHYGDFIELQGTPDSADSLLFHPQPVAITIEGRVLCFNELKHGYDYRVRFKSGFPLDRGNQFLDVMGDTYFSIPDMQPSIKFQSNSLILPTIGGPKVPVTLINTDKFKLKVFRLSNEQVLKYPSLNSLELLDQYGVEELEEQTHQVAEQQFSLTVPLNQPTSFNLDLSELVDTKKAGVYVLVIDPDDNQIAIERWSSRPTQYVMFTDIGLSSYYGNDGLRVYARSYATTEPLENTTVELISRNLEVLESRTTNAHGFVQFSQPMMSGRGGLKPIQVRAINQHGLYSYISLEGKKMDLSDRPIGGAEPLSLLNAYLFTERGVYRPGEDVVLSGLVRNKELVSPQDLPLTLKIFNAEGQEQFDRLIGHLVQGGLQYRFSIPSSSKTGRWSAKLYLDTQGNPIGSVHFSVEDYVPETLAVSLQVNQPGYTGVPINIELQSNFLYGSPASGLPVSAEVHLTPTRRLFKTYPEYVYGYYGEGIKTKRLTVSNTDNEGKTTVTIPAGLQTQYDAKQTRMVSVITGVTEPSTREVRSTLRMPVLNYDSWVGVRVKNEDEGFGQEDNIAFNLMNISSDMTPINQGQINYRVIEEDWDYHWYYSGEWKYTINRFDTGVVSRGGLITDDSGVARLELGVQQWGHYRLEVTDATSGQSTQLRYRVGWWNTTGPQSALPDQVKMALSVHEALVGEQIKLQVTPPYAGKLHLLIANESIIEERTINIPKAGTELLLDVQASWGNDAYILANVYRPGHHDVGPARAVGVSHLTIKQPQLHAQVAITAPDKIEANNLVEIEVQTNLAEGGRVVLAAVDEGILQLTNFTSPDPQKFFMAKHRLGIQIRDLYGHLIQHQDGEILRVNFGGDSDGSSGSDVAPLSTFVKPVALVSDLVPIDTNGRAIISFDVPQYTGRLRLMVVAFDDQRMGSASDDMVVRYPLVVQPIMPRFISLNDKTQVAVNLHNLELPKGEFKLKWDSSDGFFLSEDFQTVLLDGDERLTLGQKVQAIKSHEGRVGLTVTRPDGEKQHYHWDLTVITNRFIEQYEKNVFLGAGSYGLIGSDVAGLTPESRSVSVRVTDRPLLATDWISTSLSRYPLGCLEQTVSKAWPILYLNDQDKSWTRVNRQQHLTKAINHIRQMQLSSGAFSLWRGGKKAEQWLTMYAMEFLLEAKKAGFQVPEYILKNGMNYLQQADLTSDFGVEAYAIYIRTKYGQPDPGKARYLFNNWKWGATGVQAGVHLAATFGLLGDTKRQMEIFNNISQSINNPWPVDHTWQRSDYRSNIRDVALYNYYFLVSENISSESKTEVIEQLESLFDTAKSERYLSTQEKAWLLRLASLNKDAKSLDPSLPISLDFEEYTLADLGSYLSRQSSFTSVKNISSQDMYIKVNSSGINKDLSRPLKNKLEVNTKYFNFTTEEEVELREIQQGQDLLVFHVIEFGKNLTTDMELSIEAPVPAGFEIENPRLSSGRKLFNEFDRLIPEFEEYRDDRYVAAWSLDRGRRSYGIKDSTLLVGYVMRAVTPGSYLVPAIYVEDMYQPKYRANTGESHVVVIAE